MRRKGGTIASAAAVTQEGGGRTEKVYLLADLPILEID
jgi:hypothetical protein